MASIDWNEKTASYVCGKNVWFDFCQNGAGSNCTGRHGGNSGAGHIKNHRIRYQLDPVRSAVLGPYDPFRIGAATIFEGNECTGPSARFYWNTKSQANGTYYSRDDMLFGGLHDGTANSIMVPKGYIVELYDSSGFCEPKKVVKGAFKDTSHEMVCQRIQPDIDDKLSSIIVKKQPQGVATAYWQRIKFKNLYSSYEDSHYFESMQWGFSYDDHKTDPQQEAERLFDAIDLGLVFFDENSANSVSDSGSETVKRDIIDQFAERNYQKQTSWSNICDFPQGSTTQGDVSLWQFVMKTEDEKTFYSSRTAVCRTGELINKAPECPYFACIRSGSYGQDCECDENWKV